MPKNLCGHKLIPLFIMASLALLTLEACTGNNSDFGHHKGTGSATFSIQWPESVLNKANDIPPDSSATIPPIDCAALGVDAVEVEFTDSYGNYLASGTWSCSSHYGRVDDIPVGSGYWVSVAARDVLGVELFWGEKSGITITEGHTTDVGTVALEDLRVNTLIATIISPSGNQTVTAGQVINFQGSATGGTAPYTYSWNFSGAVPNSTAQSPGDVTFSTAGSYTVTFIVTDSSNKTKSASVLITVNAQQANVPFTKYLSFDGGDLVIIPDSTSLNPAQITVETWVLVNNSISSDQFFICKGGDRTTGAYILGPGNANNFVFEIGPYWSEYYIYSTSQSIVTNRWYHVAGTYDGTTMKIYVDGALQGSKDIGSVTVGNTSPLYFSYDDVAGFPYYLNGYLARVSIWNVARTVNEIQSDMNSGLTGSESGLVGYWPLNDGSGQVVHDLTSNGNNGQLGSTSGADADDPSWK